MEPIKLSQKAEEEIVNTAKMAALSNLTEKSQNLITLEDIAIYFGRHYQTFAKIISKLPNFPNPLQSINKILAHAISQAKLFVGGGLMLNVLANQVIPPPPPYQGHNRHFVKSKYLYAQIFWLMSSHLLF
ncbi:hypothetical protein BVZ87_00942 [Haemophilus influenzae]|nr:hypothetical protein BVZ87_00942 [Haemophilus influenzae]